MRGSHGVYRRGGYASLQVPRANLGYPAAPDSALRPRPSPGGSGGTRDWRFNAIRITVLAVLAALTVLVLPSAAAAHPVRLIPPRCSQRPAERLCAIHAHHRLANTYRARLGLHALPYHWGAEARPGWRGYILHRWTHIHQQWRSAWRHRPRTVWSPSWLSSALCIHSHEGTWTANTGNGYTGGMQFDTGTWLGNGGGAYAPEAYLASPHDQLVVAYHTWQQRGWSPWPATAAMCGLL